MENKIIHELTNDGRFPKRTEANFTPEQLKKLTDTNFKCNKCGYWHIKGDHDELNCIDKPIPLNKNL